MTLKRYWYYIFSFLIGLAYFIFYFTVHPLLISTSWLPILEIGYLILNSIFITAFLMKDILDERKIRMASPPIGPSWIEHGPFAVMVFLQLLITLLSDTEYLTIMVKIILSILFLVDIGWDLWQDVRAKSYRKN